MQKNDVTILYDIALSAFQPDFEKYGVYPPLLKQKQKSFLPPLMLGKTILSDEKIIGGAFILAIGQKGEIGSIFIDPAEQRKGYGHYAMSAFEQMYPGVRNWKLETPSESYHLHRFYESLGYIKTGEMKERKSGINCFIYEKVVE